MRGEGSRAGSRRLLVDPATIPETPGLSTEVDVGAFGQSALLPHMMHP